MVKVEVRHDYKLFTNRSKNFMMAFMTKSMWVPCREGLWLRALCLHYTANALEGEPCASFVSIICSY